MPCWAEVAHTWTGDLEPFHQFVERRHAGETGAVDLVERHDHRFVICAEILEHLRDGGHMLARVGVRYVKNVDQHRRLMDLLERRPEGGDQECRQFVDEPDRIRQEHGRGRH